MEEFKRVGVTGRQGKAHIDGTLKRLTNFLQSQGVAVSLDEQLSDLLPDHGLQVSSRAMMGKTCDLVVVVGGDGSLLGAGRELSVYDVPVVGVNRGRLGFLTDVSPDELEDSIGEILKGQYRMESRFLLEAKVERKGKTIGCGNALNDVVLHPGISTKIIEFELFIEDQFVYRQRSDGLIMATPTGSTAYALSGGGPIMHPKLDAIVLVPMYPHMLTNRPLVVDGNSQLKLVIYEGNEIHPRISFDGQVDIELAPDDVILIRKKKQQLKLLHPLNHNFYEACRSKLRWYPNEDAQ
ncbi:NAD(+) kinase [Endozoicomonas numazuensis]|uniref:NAD kinase n=1 Tax=Endozoicomonas numazuensis TaxID=1137799 RepID=A0A081NDZ5_9GAMM|nr:NAD(+) kinase [Endozoicomonas numazuensis]KEQ16668.1 inorganic polyphosphate kinase [Endozoicomonas numazuensis]